MELLDVLDDNGLKTGITKDKDEIYKTGEWFRSVHIWIVNDNKELLLQKRSPYKTTFPNCGLYLFLVMLWLEKLVYKQ